MWSRRQNSTRAVIYGEISPIYSKHMCSVFKAGLQALGCNTTLQEAAVRHLGVA